MGQDSKRIQNQKKILSNFICRENIKKMIPK